MSVDLRSCTRSFADYLASDGDATLPTDLVDRIKLLVLDTVGCGILGSSLPWTRTVAETMRATEAPGASLVWGTPDRLAPAAAALVNGTSVHASELDDVGAGGHHGSTTVTVALALAEAGFPTSGSDLVRAVVAGIEVAARVGDCLGPAPQVRCGFHLPALIGTFAATTTAARVMRLDASQSMHAIGTAAQLASGLMGTQHGGMGKRLAAGHAARSGLLAAQLAAHGFTSTEDIFECGYGSFPQAFSGGHETYDLTRLDAGLGEQYRSYDVAVKLWACRIPIHASLEAVSALRRSCSLDAEQIARIRVALPEAAHKAVGFPYVPTSAASAQLNLRYCLAVLLLDGDVFVDQFGDDRIAAPDVLELVARIDVVHDPELDAVGGGFAMETVVHITLAGGATLTAQGRARGPRTDPVTTSDVVTKFRKATQAVLGEDQQTHIVESCLEFDRIEDVSEFMPLLTLERSD